MPIAHVYILEGREPAQKRRAIRSVSEALADALDSPLDRIRVLIHEMALEDWGSAGQPIEMDDETADGEAK